MVIAQPDLDIPHLNMNDFEKRETVQEREKEGEREWPCPKGTRGQSEAVPIELQIIGFVNVKDWQRTAALVEV